ncbi:MAG: hypothetical protein N3A72_03245 [bacterium]|nr:hypothetical protein [bacterium]
MYYPLKKKNFLDRIKQSPDEQQIVNYFYHHPNACQTLEEIAQDLGKQPDEIEPFVRELEELGVLHNCGPLWGSPFYASRYTEFYSLSKNEELQKVFEELIDTQLLSS